MQWNCYTTFASSDNHRHLEIVLFMLKFCGLSPSFALFYVTDQDRHLLERIFPLLTNNLKYHEPSSENVIIFPILPLYGSITFPNSIESMISVIYILDDDIVYDPDIDNMVVYTDFEWPIYDFGCVKVNVSVTQIRANISNYKRHRLILPFGRHTNIQHLLIRLQLFLSQVDDVFIGRTIANDIANIKKDYQSVSFSVLNVDDIGTMSMHRGLDTKKRGTSTMQSHQFC